MSLVGDKYMIGDELKTPKELWFEEYLKESTKQRYEYDFNDFCEWAKTSDVELVKEYESAENKKRWAKRKGADIVKFYNWLRTEGKSVNYSRSKTSAIRAFLKSQCEAVQIKRGAIPKPEIAFGEHEFTQKELRKMFHFGDVKEKAILSTAVALGWGVGDFVKMRREDIKPFLSVDAFTGFWHRRGKTGVRARCHLTPESIDSLTAMLAQSVEGVYVWSNGNGKKHVTDETLNNALKEMARKAGIEPRGKIRFHALRKFLMSQLANAGITQWHIKLMVGKAIPATDATYLTGIEEQTKREYIEAYENFSLVGYQNANKDRIGELNEIIKQQDRKIELQQLQIENLGKAFGAALTEMRKHQIFNDKTYMRLKSLIKPKPKQSKEEA